MSVTLLPVQHVAAVEAATELPWLVEGLWPEQGVGFLGGRPKCCLCRARHKHTHAASRVMPRGRQGLPDLGIIPVNDAA